MKETKHDYQNCLCGNYHDGKMNGNHDSWQEFVDNWLGFECNSYDDTYHFIFRYDIHKQEDGLYTLELCAMLQRKGIYVHINVMNVTQVELDTVVLAWLKCRKDYLDSLWREVAYDCPKEEATGYCINTERDKETCEGCE